MSAEATRVALLVMHEICLVSWLMIMVLSSDQTGWRGFRIRALSFYPFSLAFADLPDTWDARKATFFFSFGLWLLTLSLLGQRWLSLRRALFCACATGMVALEVALH